MGLGYLVERRKKKKESTVFGRRALTTLCAALVGNDIAFNKKGN